MIIPYITLVSLYIFLYIINDILFFFFFPKLLRCRLVKTYHTFSWVEGGVQLVDSLSGFCLDWQGRMPELKKKPEAVREVELKAKAKEGAGILARRIPGISWYPCLKSTHFLLYKANEEIGFCWQWCVPRTPTDRRRLHEPGLPGGDVAPWTPYFVIIGSWKWGTGLIMTGWYHETS